MRLGLGVATVALGVAFCLPVAAHADKYVDHQTGQDDVGCGAIADPCQTPEYAGNISDPGDRFFVDDSGVPYPFVEMPSNRSLIATEFVGGDEGPAVIDGGTTFAVRLQGSGDGVVQGFTLRGGDPGFNTVEMGGGTLTGNIIDEETTVRDGCMVSASFDAAIRGNTFVDPTPGATPNAGVCGQNLGKPVEDNTFTYLDSAIQLQGSGTPEVLNNTITGAATYGIQIIFGTATISGNTITEPDGFGATGIAIVPVAAGVGATLRRNRVIGHQTGVFVKDTTGPVSLDGDVIAGSTFKNFESIDAAPAGDTDVSMTNVTIADPTFFIGNVDVSLVETHLDVDSSFISSSPEVIGDASCAISYSASFSSGTPGDLTDCNDFQVTAGPLFVDRPGRDLHLASGSPLIDAGNPAAPAAESLDLDGGPRATDGNGDGIARRDIGADESAAVAPPPPTTPGTPAQPPAGKKKCKKKKGKKAVAAKKKKCKRKKKR